MKTYETLNESNKLFVKQFHNGISRILILWIISQQKIHGYGISIELDKFFKVFREDENFSEKSKKFNPAKIYPILKKMEENGLIKSEEGVINNKNVKFYEITNEGTKFLDSIKVRWVSLIHDDLWVEFFNDMTGYDKQGG
ncbi:MAG: PadR family transcriptional regulator [Methanobrevibacter sp.]|nr:PadR family transcriptional regulator [Methanobrevibacter sp.]